MTRVITADATFEVKVGTQDFFVNVSCWGSSSGTIKLRPKNWKATFGWTVTRAWWTIEKSGKASTWGTAYRQALRACGKLQVDTKQPQRKSKR